MVHESANPSPFLTFFQGNGSETGFLTELRRLREFHLCDLRVSLHILTRNGEGDDRLPTVGCPVEMVEGLKTMMT